MEKNTLFLISAFLLLMGILFSTGAFFLLFQSHALKKNLIHAQGTAIDLHMKYDEDGTNVYAPVIRFVTSTGREFTFTGTIYSKPPAYQPGQTVKVVYPANQPDQARIKNESNLLIIAFGGLSGVLILLGLCLGFMALLASISG